MLAPCARCCPCLEEREFLLRGRRSTLSVSTHDDDWDAEVGFDNKNARKAAKSSAEMDREMQLQMQQLSRNVTRSMQNVAVTDEEDVENLGTNMETSNLSLGQAKKESWRGYKSSALNTEDDAYSSGSDKHSSGQNSPVGSVGDQSPHRKPYRDAPYSDTKPAESSPKAAGGSSGSGSGSAAQQRPGGKEKAEVLRATEGTRPGAGAAAGGVAGTGAGAGTAAAAGQEQGRDEEDDDEEVEISLL
jgi:hypothetical protein